MYCFFVIQLVMPIDKYEKLTLEQKLRIAERLFSNTSINDVLFLIELFLRKNKRGAK